MCFGVECHRIEIQRLRREQQVEILEGFRKNETLHAILLAFAHDVSQRRVADIGAAVFDEIAE